MVKGLNFRRSLIGCYCLWILLFIFSKMPVTQADDASIYRIEIMQDQTKHGWEGVHNHFYMYFPTTMAAQTYPLGWLGSGGTKYINDITQMIFLNYPVHIKWTINFGNKSNDNHEDPIFDICQVNRDGTIGSSLIGGPLQFYNQTRSNEFDLAPNTGFRVYVDTGYRKTDIDSGKDYYRGFTSYFEIQYQIDTTPPNTPVIQLSNQDSPQIKNINGVLYSSLNPTDIEWANPGDPPPMATGVQKFTIFNHDQAIAEEAVDSIKNIYSITSEGNYAIQVKALDLNNNVSNFSNTIDIVTDYSVALPTLPENPVQIIPKLQADGQIQNDILVNWNPVTDATGIDHYEIALSKNSSVPGEFITTQELQHTFTGISNDTMPYYFYVRAIDGLGNGEKGPWQKIDGFIVSSPLTNITAIQPHSELRNGQPYYEVAFTLEEVEAASYVIERQRVGDSARITLAEMSKTQLADNNYKYTDNNNLSPGRYIYYVYTKSPIGARSVERTVVVIIDIYEEQGEKQPPIYLTEDQEWSGIVHLQGDVVVIPGEVTLTILPGTQVIVDKNCSLTIYGKLKADNVTFQSTPGATGSWNGIQVEGEAKLNQVTIEGATRGLAVIQGASLSITDSTFSKNQVGLHVYGTSPQVTTCSFLNNSLYGIKEDEGGRPIVISCKFSGNGMDYYSEILTELSMDELKKME